MLKNRIFFLLSIIILFSSCVTPGNKKEYNNGIHITPVPNSIIEKGAYLEFKKNSKVYCEKEEWINIVSFITERLNKTYGTSQFIKNEHKADICVKCDSTLEEEEYKVKVDNNKVLISASTEKGTFYAVQTVLQLFPAEIEGNERINAVINVPLVEIQDKPRFKYRGVMIDVCRHFFTVAELKKQIDIMAMLKLNYLHLHLSDNVGWRLEIEKYPQLIEMSSVSETYTGKKYGPFYYTKQDMKEIIDFAKKRQIEIIPEIEFPGHSESLLVPFPNLSCNGKPHISEQLFNFNESTLCVANNDVYIVMQNILKEVAELFPCKYLHIGGDESVKTNWEKCPKCQGLAKRLALKRTKDYSIEEQLQSYAIKKNR